MTLSNGLLVAALAGAVAASTLSAQCIGDCRGDGVVTIDELMILVDIAMDETALAACRSGDVNGDSLITVNEIIAAVNKALVGCIPDVNGTWQQDQVTIAASTCAPAITTVVQESIDAGESNCTFRIEQSGAHLDITSMCPGETDTFDGTVDANGLLTVTSSEQETMDDCTIMLTETTSGMVAASPTVGTHVMEFRFSPQCGFADCSITVRARWTKVGLLP